MQSGCIRHEIIGLWEQNNHSILYNDYQTITRFDTQFAPCVAR
jgi:hypothetical protein